ncbi:hypothetical protein [Marinigracilibium pacificum]|uniref:Long-subunit fatty acid transport protein n=1 Tax=Marinigracilibium pacificum TaxID=2729599 RepID=A0A848IY25_9BACT|nr:hypothetical protein [Marinigracilibium pacificum]NMM46879.1 hypothetical protein [Marinigracilibium pacificum]
MKLVFNKYILLLAFILVGLPSLNAQVLNSPYTSYGVGEVMDNSLSHNQSMGGVGIGLPSFVHLNNVNPAWLPFNKLSTFEAAISGERRTIESSLGSTSPINGSVRYLTFGVPLKLNYWNLSVGLSPYSVVNYDFLATGDVPNEEGINLNRLSDGEGGIGKVFIAQGFQYKNVYLGIRFNYFFGATSRTSGQYVGDSDTLISRYVIKIADRRNVSDFNFDFGVGYDLELDKNTFLNFGAVYTPETKVKTKYLSTFRRETLTGTTVDADTILDTKGTQILPQQVGFGVGLRKLKAGYNHWSVGFDATFDKWSAYNRNDGQDILRNSSKFAIGGAFTPDATNIESYLKRITYRLGGFYKKTPYNLNNQGLDEFGMNLGFHLPVKNASVINLVLGYGSRGSLSDNVLKEQYFSITIGATFNGKRWEKAPWYN